MTDDLNRLRAVTLTDDERDSILNADSRSHMFRRIESIVAARTAALIDRAERAEAERDDAQEYRDLYKLELDAADADLAALRAAVTNLADSIDAWADEWQMTEVVEESRRDLATDLLTKAAEAVRSLLAAAPTETEGTTDA